MSRREPVPAPPLDLAATQRLLRELIAAPEGVRAALADRGDPEGQALARIVAGDDALAAPARLDVYANAYFYRLLEVAQSDYPGLRRALGDRALHDLLTSYLLAAPPRHYSLRHAGDRLPAFVAGSPAAARVRERFPFAADLARFERALTDAFDAGDEPLASRDDLAGLAPERFAELPLRLAPGVQRLSLEHAVHELSREPLETEQPDPSGATAARADTELLVWRRHHSVRHRALDPLEARALARVEAGTSFADVCGTLEAVLPGDEAAARAAGWLAEWLDARLLARVDLPAGGETAG